MEIPILLILILGFCGSIVVGWLAAYLDASLFILSCMTTSWIAAITLLLLGLKTAAKVTAITLR